jgi:DNA-binding CsgD family transcriptional regulator
MVAELIAPQAQAWAVDARGRAHLLRLGHGFDAPLDVGLVGDMALTVHATELRVRPEATRWHDGRSWLHVRHVATAPRFRGDSLTAVVLATRAALPFGVTARELDALTLAAQGLTNNEIAARLFISARTAGHHLENVTVKLQASNRASCVSVATAWGLLSGHVLHDSCTASVATAAG